jgi:hypothetical protein
MGTQASSMLWVLEDVYGPTSVGDAWHASMQGADQQLLRATRR